MAKFTVIVFACALTTALAVPLPQEEDIGERIVGGSPAPDGWYPHQVSLRQSNSHFCGGSIISNRWILTAAHCTYGERPADILIVVGTNHLNSGGVGYGVQQIVIHQGYNQENNQNDISLLYVAGSIGFNYKVQPIGLASYALPAGSPCILSGWGLTSYPSQSLPNDLQHIGLTSITVGQCASALPGFPVYNTHVCTYQGVGQGACQGDSGGPLISGGIQVGVVSWGVPCANGAPDIFTAVSSYRSWIRSVSGV